MFSNMLLSVGLLVASFALPDVSQMPLINQGSMSCPNGTSIHVEIFDPDPSIPAVVVRFSRGGEVIGLIDGRDDKAYVPKDQRVYTMDEIQEKYGTPCNLPDVIKS